MQKIYTENDIVRYIYNEVSPAERQRIESAMEKDMNLKQAYIQLMDAVRRLDAIKQNPNPSSIELVLEYSRASSQMEASL